MNIGDVDVPFCVQSTSKPVTYCVALEINGETKVHEHVGREPSGRNFNDRSLMQQDGGKKHSIPHNPYINAGAIMTSSLVKMDVSEWDRFTYMMTIWQKLSGGIKPSFQNDTFMGERSTASRNFCLAYMMEEEEAFPANTDLQKTLEAYFSWCSIEVTAQSMACVAATLANGGICPTTNERIFTNHTVTSCLALMMSCGMYDYSGQFAFEIGFPAKSGVSGVLCVVIPRICGFATFSPRLDKLGNSVRGIDFCQRLVKHYPFHVFSLAADWENWCPKEAQKNAESGKRKLKKKKSSFMTEEFDDGGSAREKFQKAIKMAQAEKQQQAEKAENSAKSTMGALFGSDPDVLKKNAFTGWQKVAKSAKQLMMRFGKKWLHAVFPEKEFTAQVSEQEDSDDEDEGIDLVDAATSLWWSAHWGDETRIRQLAVNGIDVNLMDYDQRTALHISASEGHDRMVQLLIALKADITACDMHGATPEQDASREHRHSAKRILQLAARNQRENKLFSLTEKKAEANIFNYFVGKSVVGEDGIHRVLKATLTEVLDTCGLSTENDPRFVFLEDFPPAFTEDDIKKAAKKNPILKRALKGCLVVPNFALLCEKFEQTFTEMVHQIQESDPSSKCQDEALNVMTVDGQRLHLGRSEQYICAGDLIGIAIFAKAIELLGQDMVMTHIGCEPSGANSDASVLNGDRLPYNPFMWNGTLTLLSLLEEKCGGTIQIIENVWAKLCQEHPKQRDETWMEEDKEKHYHRVQVLLHTSLDIQKFPDKVPPDTVMEMFFSLRSLKTSTMDLGCIGAVVANCGKHPLTGEQIFQTETVQGILSMMYSAGCNSQSGEFSFKVGVPAKSTSEGAVLLVLPNVMGLCVVSPKVNHNGVSLGASHFCDMFGTEFNCHILSGTATSAAKQDPTLYHMQTDMELSQQLMFAAEKGELMTISALNQLGFSLDYTDYDYRSAAHIAACNNQHKALKYLQKKGANVNIRDRWGCSPLDEAKRLGYRKVVRFLETCTGIKSPKKARASPWDDQHSGPRDDQHSETVVSDAGSATPPLSPSSPRTSAKTAPKPQRSRVSTAATAVSPKQATRQKKDSAKFTTLAALNGDADEDEDGDEGEDEEC
jgi:glutaminase